MKKQNIIKEYFRSWIDKDPTVMNNYFDRQITYTECYGPVYIGKDQCLDWFTDWNKIGSVLKWDILNIYNVRNTYIVEWYFECNFENNIDGFDGVSIIEFNKEKIISVKEFQSKHQHNYPYENK